jgi:adenylyl- and sulfurtransferase ThiI
MAAQSRSFAPIECSELTLMLFLQFAVRPNMRNHNTMKRDAIIKMVAGLVGQPHKVDLKNYDLLITIEIYQVWI